jgi:hypothetical protein
VSLLLLPMGCHERPAGPGAVDGGNAPRTVPAPSPSAQALAESSGAGSTGPRPPSLSLPAPTGSTPDGGTASAASGTGRPSSNEAAPPLGIDLEGRARHLLEAIAQDNPHLAADILFPREAFYATRDSAPSSHAWETTVSGPFARGIHQLHRRYKGIDRAQFVGLDLGPRVTKAVPRRRDWKVPVWKVRQSRLYVTIDGDPKDIPLGELVSWYGSWYVLRLR